MTARDLVVFGPGPRPDRDGYHGGMTHLFDPMTLRSVSFANRLWLAPMCQYSAREGLPNDWHFQHLVSRALGGFGLVLTEATAVTPEGRISPDDVGLWNDDQLAAWERIVTAVHEAGTRIGVQLAHAGRKASTFAPWRGDGPVPLPNGGWVTVGPSTIAFPGYAEPSALDQVGIDGVVAAFADAAARAVSAGFDAIEIHAAHGYLVHQFLSPLSNDRVDAYGGSLVNRARLLLRILEGVRSAIPDGMPVLVRYSATDWTEGGLSEDDIARVAVLAGERGADFADVSTGGLVPARIPLGHGYQVPFAERVRDEGIPVGAVGLITGAHLADAIVAEGRADAVLVGRIALRDPYWPRRAAHELGASIPWPPQYERGRWGA